MTCWRHVDAHHRSLVLISFICGRLVFIHLDTSLTQAHILCVRSSTCGGSQNPLIWVSSAYPCGTRLWRFISYRTSAMYRRNKIGRRTEPWGLRTAVEMVWNWTWLIGPLRYDSNQSSTASFRPYNVSSHCKSVSWSTFLNDNDFLVCMLYKYSY